MRPYQMKQTIFSEEVPLFYCMMPVEAHTSKKNSKRIFKNSKGQMFIGGDKKSLGNLQSLINNFTLQGKKQLDEPINEPIKVTMRFHYPYTKKGLIPKKIMDLSNLYQGPEDALQKAGVIKDDSLIESHDGSCRVYGSDRKYIEVAIYRHEKLFF